MTYPTLAPDESRSVTVSSLRRMKAKGEKIVMLTAYDASFAARLDAAGVDVILVGDSLGMVIQGRESTIPVTVDDMVYHTRAVRAGCKRALVIADMPFLSYTSAERALDSAGRLMAEGGAHMVKLEGGREIVAVVQALANAGIAVCAHLGLRPQSVNKLGGYSFQAKDDQGAQALMSDAEHLVAAGADIIVLECVPAALARALTGVVEVPVIGIGAGQDCDGQVLVLYDMLGITPGRRPSFSHDFLAEHGSIEAALAGYVDAVRSARFPDPAHTLV